MIVYNEGVDTDVILAEDLNKYYLKDYNVMGKTYNYTIKRLDHSSFKVNITGIGAVPNVTNIVYTENSSSRLMFWNNHTMTFKTECLKGKVVTFSLDGENIIIDIKEK